MYSSCDRVSFHIYNHARYCTVKILIGNAKEKGHFVIYGKQQIRGGGAQHQNLTFCYVVEGEDGQTITSVILILADITLKR